MRERRYRTLVDGFQFRLFMRVVSYGLIYQITLWTLLFSWYLLREGAGDLRAQYWDFFVNNYPMLLIALVLAPAFGWDAVRFSHRVAGPLTRFRTTLRQIATDEPVRRIRLRDGDELTDMQDDFNAALDHLAGRGAIELIATEPHQGTAADAADEAMEEVKHVEIGS